MSLLKYGDFTLSCGAKSIWKIDCDHLTESDLEVGAGMIYKLVGPFREVIGVPKGGMLLANHLEQYATSIDKHPILIVDDVWTTGGNINRMLVNVAAERNLGHNQFVCGVLFARGPTPPWVHAVFTLHLHLQGN